jgi:hypothetical protein
MADGFAANPWSISSPPHAVAISNTRVVAPRVATSARSKSGAERALVDAPQRLEPRDRVCEECNFSTSVPLADTWESVATFARGAGPMSWRGQAAPKYIISVLIVISIGYILSRLADEPPQNEPG